MREKINRKEGLDKIRISFQKTKNQMVFLKTQKTQPFFKKPKKPNGFFENPKKPK